MSDHPKLSLDQLQPNPLQPREKIKKEHIQDLADSIKQLGILEPLVVAKTPAGYQIIAGERRWRAAKEAGLTEVPVHIIETTRRGMLEMALVENVQRTDLSPLERALAFKRLQREFNLKPKEIGERIGKSNSYVTNSMNLLDLPDAIKDGLTGDQITEGHARALSQIDNEKHMVEAYKTILKEGGSVRRAEELARHYQFHHSNNPGKRIHLGDRTKTEQRIPQWRELMKAQFRAPSDLKLVRSSRQTKVTITLKGSPQETQLDMEKLMSVITNKDDETKKEKSEN